MLEWVNPDKELPSIGTCVIIAVGVREFEIEGYRLAKVGVSGSFYISNGAYSDNCLYSKNSPHHTNNQYRVIAWAEFDKCNIDSLEFEIE